MKHRISERRVHRIKRKHRRPACCLARPAPNFGAANMRVMTSDADEQAAGAQPCDAWRDGRFYASGRAGALRSMNWAGRPIRQAGRLCSRMLGAARLFES